MDDLVAMGFDPELVRQALDECNNNHDLAIEILLTFGGDHSEQNHHHYENRLHEDSSQNKSDHDFNDDCSDYIDKMNDDHSLIVCDTSQYTIENGKSACTCIALAAATQFFQEPWTVTTPQFLQDMIFQGVIIYNQLVSNQIPSSLSLSSSSSASSSLTCSTKVILPSVEHMSAEEILHHHPHSFPLSIVGDISQGVLSHDYNHPLGLKSRLEALISSYYNPDEDDVDDDTVNDKGDAKDSNDNKKSQSNFVVLLTKTPETVLICHRHSPSIEGNRNGQEDCISNDNPRNDTIRDEWILIDSHPRPPLSSNAYARRHRSLDDLVRTIHTIFPPTNLDPDVPEMMTMLYNSFDLYQLEYDQKEDKVNCTWS
jgi:UBA/TS-N domain